MALDPTVWSGPNSSGAFALDQTQLIAAASQQVMGHAVDMTNKKYWRFQGANSAQQWNNDNSTNQNPATGAGGVDISALTGSLYAGWGSYNAAAAPLISGQLNAGSFPFNYTMPSGFSSINTHAGATATWDSGNKSANIALSEGNLLASHTTNTGTWATVRCTHALPSSGKVYWENTTVDKNTGGFPHANMGGILMSGALTGAAMGFTTDTLGWYGNDFVTRLNNSSIVSAQDRTSGHHNMRATNGWTTGKKLFAVTIDDINNPGGNPGNTGVGLVNSSYARWTELGNQTNGVAYYASGGNVKYLNSDLGVPGIWLGGVEVLVAVDLGARKIWFRESSSGATGWNGGTIGAQDPETNTGGYDISGLTGTLYPAIDSEQARGVWRHTLNCAGSFTQASFANAAPSYTPWDTPAITAWSRGYIIG